SAKNISASMRQAAPWWEAAAARSIALAIRSWSSWSKPRRWPARYGSNCYRKAALTAASGPRIIGRRGGPQTGRIGTVTAGHSARDGTRGDGKRDDGSDQSFGRTPPETGARSVFPRQRAARPRHSHADRPLGT